MQQTADLCSTNRAGLSCVAILRRSLCAGMHALVGFSPLNVIHLKRVHSKNRKIALTQV